MDGLRDAGAFATMNARLSILWTFVACLAFAFATTFQWSSPPAPRIVMFGDSHMALGHWSLEVGDDVLNLGHGGDTCIDLFGRVTSIPQDTQMVVVSVGTNDRRLGKICWRCKNHLQAAIVQQ